MYMEWPCRLAILDHLASSRYVSRARLQEAHDGGNKDHKDKNLKNEVQPVRGQMVAKGRQELGRAFATTVLPESKESGSPVRTTIHEATSLSVLPQCLFAVSDVLKQ